MSWSNEKRRQWLKAKDDVNRLGQDRHEAVQHLRDAVQFALDMPDEVAKHLNWEGLCDQAGTVRDMLEPFDDGERAEPTPVPTSGYDTPIWRDGVR